MQRTKEGIERRREQDRERKRKKYHENREQELERRRNYHERNREQENKRNRERMQLDALGFRKQLADFRKGRIGLDELYRHVERASLRVDARVDPRQTALRHKESREPCG